jgi:hypothetical protein
MAFGRVIKNLRKTVIMPHLHGFRNTEFEPAARAAMDSYN